MVAQSARAIQGQSGEEKKKPIVDLGACWLGVSIPPAHNGLLFRMMDMGSFTSTLDGSCVRVCSGGSKHLERVCTFKMNSFDPI